jgi:hypothetical protein
MQDHELSMPAWRPPSLGTRHGRYPAATHKAHHGELRGAKTKQPQLDYLYAIACEADLGFSHSYLGDLISYQNDEKGCTAIPGKVERA